MMARRTLPVRLAGAIVALWVAGAGALAVHHDRTPDGAGAYLAAERRSLLGSWVVDERLTRLVNSRPGQPLVETVRRAQRPPDFLVAGAGAVESVYHGRRLACAPGPDGALHCRDGGVAPPYQTRVEAQLAVLAAYVGGSRPRYRVAEAAGGCFVLRLGPHHAATRQLGTLARRCFDPATGAPVRTEVSRPEGQDVTVALRVSGTVTDEDLRPPA